MTDIGSTGYMTDGEIIAWLQEKSSDQYSNLRNCMNISNDRSDLMNRLTSLRADIDGGAAPADVLAEMQKIQTDYAGTPYAPELDQLLVPMEIKLLPGVPQDGQQKAFSDVAAGVDQATVSDGDKSKFKAQLGTAQVLTAIPLVDDVLTKNQFTAGSATYKDFSEKLQGETEQLGRVDSLALIKIQEIMSDAHQTDQLGSNILASRDQASNSIVGNIRG